MEVLTVGEFCTASAYRNLRREHRSGRRPQDNPSKLFSTPLTFLHILLSIPLNLLSLSLSRFICLLSRFSIFISFYPRAPAREAVCVCRWLFLLSFFFFCFFLVFSFFRAFCSTAETWTKVDQLYLPLSPLLFYSAFPFRVFTAPTTTIVLLSCFLLESFVSFARSLVHAIPLTRISFW